MVKTKESIYSDICQWENEAGESFVDCFNVDIHPLTFMTWCLGRKYITSDKYDMWAESYGKNRLESDDPNYFVYNSWNDEKAMFAVVVSEDWNEADQEKAYRILAEFISESRIYRNRFNDFLKGSD